MAARCASPGLPNSTASSTLSLTAPSRSPGLLVASTSISREDCVPVLASSVDSTLRASSPPPPPPLPLPRSRDPRHVSASSINSSRPRGVRAAQAKSLFSSSTARAPSGATSPPEMHA